MPNLKNIGLACLVVGVVATLPVAAHGGATEAVAAMKNGDYATAYTEFHALAEQGDAKAMVMIGLFYHQGNGIPQDYTKAMDWYLRALPSGDGDAYNNIGVMYRDGLGVTINRAIAYDLFLIVHMRSLGGAATQMRANRNLRREVGELDEDKIRYALCLSEEQVIEFVKNRGDAPAHTIELDDPHVAIKDREWWLEGELPAFDCT